MHKSARRAAFDGLIIASFTFVNVAFEDCSVSPKYLVGCQVKWRTLDIKTGSIRFNMNICRKASNLFLLYV